MYKVLAKSFFNSSEANYLNINFTNPFICGQNLYRAQLSK